VHDLFLTIFERLIAKCKKDLEVEFDKKDLGLVHYFMGFRDVVEERYTLGMGIIQLRS